MKGFIELKSDEVESKFIRITAIEAVSSDYWSNGADKPLIWVNSVIRLQNGHEIRCDVPTREIAKLIEEATANESGT